jgi:hypothetical protein
MIINKKRYKGLQIYKQKRSTNYFLVDFNNHITDNKNRILFECIAPCINNSLCTSTIWIDSNFFYPVTWKKTPKIWQDKFIEYILSEEI